MKRTAIRRKRPGTRRGQPTPAEVKAMRDAVYERAGGRCELRLAGCRGEVLPKDGDVFERFHMVHLRAKRRFGTHMDALCGGCWNCHIGQVHQGKYILPHTYDELIALRASEGRNNGGIVKP